MDLFFRKEGLTGKNIVILHGLYGSSDNWFSIGKKLGENFHVYLIDQRNHGRSKNTDIHTYDAMEKDLFDFFDKHQIQKAVVIGHSMGGKVAMLFAANHPEKIEKLIIVDIAPVNYMNSPDKGQYNQHLKILQSLSEFQKKSHDFKTRTEIAGFLMEKLSNETLVRFLLKSTYRDRETRLFRCRINTQIIKQSLNEIIGGINEENLLPLAPITDYPVLFIKGESSEYITKDCLPVIQKIYPEYIIKIIPDAGHWLHAEHPNIFLKIVRAFIG